MKFQSAELWERDIFVAFYLSGKWWWGWWFPQAKEPINVADRIWTSIPLIPKPLLFPLSALDFYFFFFFNIYSPRVSFKGLKNYWRTEIYIEYLRGSISLCGQLRHKICFDGHFLQSKQSSLIFIRRHFWMCALGSRAHGCYDHGEVQLFSS